MECRLQSFLIMCKELIPRESGGGGRGGNTYHFLTNEKPPFKHICFFVLLLHSLVSEEGREKIFYEKPFGESGEKKYLGGSCLFVGVNNNIIIPLSSHP